MIFFFHFRSDIGELILQVFIVIFSHHPLDNGFLLVLDSLNLSSLGLCLFLYCSLQIIVNSFLDFFLKSIGNVHFKKLFKFLILSKSRVIWCDKLFWGLRSYIGQWHALILLISLDGLILYVGLAFVSVNWGNLFFPKSMEFLLILRQDPITILMLLYKEFSKLRNNNRGSPRGFNWVFETIRVHC